MVEYNTGEKLKAARQGRGLTPEDVARATKMRVRQVLDLENEDYSNFANLTYAKGFLKLYAEYLDVDLEESLSQFQPSRTVTADDYQYLHRPPVGRTKAPKGPPRSPLSVIKATAAIILIGAASLYAWQLARDIKRLGPGTSPVATVEEELQEEGEVEKAAAVLARNAPAEIMEVLLEPAPAPGASAVPPQPWPAAEEQEEELVEGPLPPSFDTLPVFSPQQRFGDLDVEEPPQIRRAEMVRPAAAIGSPSESSSYEVTIKPVRETWVTVRRNSRNAPPYYDAWLAEPLEFQADKVWIAVDDPEAVEIFKNGEKIAATGMDLVID